MAKMNEIYKKVADNLRARMESGQFQEWQQEYVRSGKGGKGNMIFPISLSTGKNYSGINFGLLMMAQMMHGFSSTTWGTFKQFKAKGGSINKGEKGTQILFFNFMYFDAQDNKMSEKQIKAGEPYARKIAFAREYTVFNLDQQTGYEAPATTATVIDPTDEESLCAEAEKAIAAYTEKEGVRLTHHDGSTSPYYNPAGDFIAMPERSLYSDMNSYYKTYFHEASHSTGHKNRLDRDTLKDYSDSLDIRATEEVTAEVSALFIATFYGIAFPSQEDNTASYVDHWKGNATDNDKAWYNGLKQAEKACQYFLNAVGETTN